MLNLQHMQISVFLGFVLDYSTSKLAAYAENLQVKLLWQSTDAPIFYVYR